MSRTDFRMSRTRHVFATLLLGLFVAACGGEKPGALVASAKEYLARKELDALAALGGKFGGQAEVASLLKSL